MTNLFKEEYNCETGKLKQIPLTDEEIAIWEAEAIKMQEFEKAQQAEKLAKDALLVKLGITEEEAKLLLS